MTPGGALPPPPSNQPSLLIGLQLLHKRLSSFLTVSSKEKPPVVWLIQPIWFSWIRSLLISECLIKMYIYFMTNIASQKAVTKG